MNVWVKAKFTFMHMLQANKKSKRTINTQRERERRESSEEVCFRRWGDLRRSVVVVDVDRVYLEGKGVSFKMPSVYYGLDFPMPPSGTQHPSCEGGDWVGLSKHEKSKSQKASHVEFCSFQFYMSADS